MKRSEMVERIYESEIVGGDRIAIGALLMFIEEAGMLPPHCGETFQDMGHKWEAEDEKK